VETGSIHVAMDPLTFATCFDTSTLVISSDSNQHCLLCAGGGAIAEVEEWFGLKHQPSSKPFNQRDGTGGAASAVEHKQLCRVGLVGHVSRSASVV
jgi:hypothetical protein